MSQQKYKETLQKWAKRCNATVDIESKRYKVYDLGVESGNVIISTLKCSLLAMQFTAQKTPDETVEQCEQRCAQEFLRTFAASPLGRA